MHLSSLGSGSRGNGTLLRHGDTCVLVDCGFTFRQLERRLGEVGLRPEDLSAVLVTHEHSDHAQGVSALKRRTGVAVHASAGTWRGMKCAPGRGDGLLSGDAPLMIGNIEVLPVTVPHDAREPLQFRFSAAGVSIGVLTDLGHPSRHVVERFHGCDGLLLEFNHDADLLREGRYPESLKRRVGGRFGHLANTQATELLAALAPERLQWLVAGHLSEQNNTPEHAAAAVDAVMCDAAAEVYVARQDHCSEWFEVATG